MKTNFVGLCMALFTLVSFNAFAQSPFHLGIKATSNHSNISGDLKNLSKSTGLGFSAGITTRYDIDRLYLQADLMYSEQKANVDTHGVSSAKWKSIEVPLTVGFHLLDFNTVKVHVFGGAVYSHLINDKLTFKENIKTVDTNFNKSNIKAKLGVGVDIGKFTVDLAYSRGLNNLSKDFKSKSNNVNIGVSYYFL